MKILLSLVLLIFTFSCEVNSEKPTKPLPLSKDFILIKGATMEGAIQAEEYTESPGIIA